MFSICFGSFKQGACDRRTCKQGNSTLQDLLLRNISGYAQVKKRDHFRSRGGGLVHPSDHKNQKVSQHKHGSRRRVQPFARVVGPEFRMHLSIKLTKLHGPDLTGLRRLLLNSRYWLHQMWPRRRGPDTRGASLYDHRIYISILICYPIENPRGPCGVHHLFTFRTNSPAAIALPIVIVLSCT